MSRDYCRRCWMRRDTFCVTSVQPPASVKVCVTPQYSVAVLFGVSDLWLTVYWSLAPRHCVLWCVLISYWLGCHCYWHIYLKFSSTVLYHCNHHSLSVFVWWDQQTDDNWFCTNVNSSRQSSLVNICLIFPRVLAVGKWSWGNNFRPRTITCESVENKIVLLSEMSDASWQRESWWLQSKSNVWLIRLESAACKILHIHNQIQICSEASWRNFHKPHLACDVNDMAA